MSQVSKGGVGAQHHEKCFVHVDGLATADGAEAPPSSPKSLSPGCSRHCRRYTGSHHLLCSGHRSAAIEMATKDLEMSFPGPAICYRRLLVK